MLDNLKIGDRLVLFLRFDTMPNFSAPFQWRHYDLAIDDPGDYQVGETVEVKCKVVGLRPILRRRI